MFHFFHRVKSFEQSANCISSSEAVKIRVRFFQVVSCTGFLVWSSLLSSFPSGSREDRCPLRQQNWGCSMGHRLAPHCLGWTFPISMCLWGIAVTTVLQKMWSLRTVLSFSFTSQCVKVVAEKKQSTVADFEVLCIPCLVCIAGSPF